MSEDLKYGGTEQDEIAPHKHYEASMDEAYPRPNDYENGKMKEPDRPDKSPFPSPWNMPSGMKLQKAGRYYQ